MSLKHFVFNCQQMFPGVENFTLFYAISLFNSLNPIFPGVVKTSRKETTANKEVSDFRLQGIVMCVFHQNNLL